MRGALPETTMNSGFTALLGVADPVGTMIASESIIRCLTPGAICWKHAHGSPNPVDVNMSETRNSPPINAVQVLDGRLSRL